MRERLASRLRQDFFALASYSHVLVALDVVEQHLNGSFGCARARLSAVRAAAVRARVPIAPVLPAAVLRACLVVTVKCALPGQLAALQATTPFLP